MRNTFAKEVLAAAKKNSNILLLTADLGFSVFEDFEKELPRQYLNTGCSEANTASMAAGLALSGKKVFIYSIVPFITMRCFEQIRVDIAYHQVDVTVVGVGGGLAYGALGATHHSIEDIALMRALPNMKIICPADPYETSQATQQLIQCGGPSYLRLNRGGDDSIHDSEPPFQIGKAYTLEKGNDFTLIATGPLVGMAQEAIRHAKAEKGLAGRLIDMHTIKPLDQEVILKSIRETKAIVTLEEHNIIGGLGSAVAEVIAESGKAIPFKRMGINDRFTKEVGRQETLRKCHGLEAVKVYETVMSLLL